MMNYNRDPTTKKALLISTISGLISSVATHPIWTIKTRVMLTMSQRGVPLKEQNVIY
jgi:hypothetical protein